jgi:hypothetical protein
MTLAAVLCYEVFFKPNITMNLGAYINFVATLDKSTLSPEIRITDTGSYPGGVPPTLTGYFTVQQPDGVVVASGSFSSPSVFWNGSSLTVTTIALRLRADGNFQRGGYLFTYYLRAPGYTDTTLTKTFQLAYSRPTLDIANGFNIFTPLLVVSDTTDYVQAGMSLSSTTRAWSALIHSVSGVDQTVTGSLADLDLAYLGDYYDASFAINLTVTPVYTLNTPDDWVTIIDKIAATTLTLQSQVPQSITQLDTSLQALKDKADASANCTTCKDRDNYSYASALYSDFRRRGCDAAFGGLTKTYFQLIKLLNNGVNPSYTHTNAPLAAYDFHCGDFTTTVPWTAITGKPSTVLIEWTVGTGGFPLNGATTLVDSRLTNIPPAQVRVFRNPPPQFMSDQGDGDTYITKVTADNFLTFHPAINTGEKVIVVILAL